MSDWRWLVTTAALAVVAPVFAQSYPIWDPRNPQYQQEENRRREESRRQEEEEKRRKQAEEDEETEKKQRAKRDAELAPLRREQARQSAETAAATRALRARLLSMPALPPERNPLLGRWRVQSSGKARAGDELSQLMNMMSNPGSAMCGILFGSGVTEFMPRSWASIDGSGNDSLGPIQYRMHEGRIFALPDKGIEVMGFEVVDANRIREARMPDCVLVRAGGAAHGAPTTPAANDASRSTGGPPPPVSRAAPHAGPPGAQRPSPQICSQTLLDKLGKAGVNHVRAMANVRFSEPLIEGRVPNTNNLRLDLRGSACDDRRLNATLYDFDASGTLQSITFVWDRPAGPAPAPIFSERVRALSQQHGLTPPQSPNRLQANTSLGRLIVQDMPERNLLLEAYATPR